MSPVIIGLSTIFFTRKIKKDARPVNMNPNVLISPCDSKLTVYKIGENSRFMIKGTEYGVSSFLRCAKLAEKYKDGWFMIFRLGVSDYHRYIYIDDGCKSKKYSYSGYLSYSKPHSP